MKTNHEICGCGDCESAMQRGLKFVCDELVNDQNCPSYIFTIGVAIQAIAGRLLYERSLAHHPELENPTGRMGIFMAAEAHCAELHGQMGEHMRANEKGLVLSAVDALCAFEARLAEERQHRKDDTTFDGVDISELLNAVRGRKTD